MWRILKQLYRLFKNMFIIDCEYYNKCKYASGDCYRNYYYCGQRRELKKDDEKNKL